MGYHTKFHRDTAFDSIFAVFRIENSHASFSDTRYCPDAGAVAQLLAAGAEVRAVTKDGRTALHLAAEGGNAAAVDCLIAAEADVGARGQFRRTALHCAAMNGYADIVDRLLAAEHNVNATDNGSETALIKAVWAGGHAAVVRVAVIDRLIAAKADVNAKTVDGQPPLPTLPGLGCKPHLRFREAVGPPVTPTLPGLGCKPHLRFRGEVPWHRRSGLGIHREGSWVQI